jgi:hypothetical protein
VILSAATDLASSIAAPTVVLLTVGAVALGIAAARPALRALLQSPRGRAAWVHASNCFYLHLVLRELLSERDAGLGAAEADSPGADPSDNRAPSMGVGDAEVRSAVHDALALVRGAAPAADGAQGCPAVEADTSVETFEEVAGRDPRAFLDAGAYREAYRSGGFTDADLEAVLAERTCGQQVAARDLQAWLSGPALEVSVPAPSYAAVAATLTGKPWPELVARRLAAWAQRYLGAGETLWSSPFRDLPPYKAWLEEMAIDCSDTVLGLEEAQAVLRDLPRDAAELVADAPRLLRIPEDLVESCFSGLLMQTVTCLPALSGSGPTRLQVRGEGEFLMQLLAIRLGWEVILMQEFRMAGGELAWRRALQRARREADRAHGATGDACLLAAHEAYEHAEHRRVAAALYHDGMQPAETGTPAPQVFLVAPEAAAPALDARPEHHVHPYDPSRDEDFHTLEELMTGAMAQAARDRLHGPLSGRLAAYVAAPITAINAIIDRHESLRHLVDNGWLRLYAVYEDGGVIVRYDGNLHWAPATVQDVA